MSTEFQARKQELAERAAKTLLRAEKEKDVRDILLEHAMLVSYRH